MMKSFIGPIGAFGYLCVVIIGVSIPMFLFPLLLSWVIPGSELTGNWTVAWIVISSLLMFGAGMVVVPLVRLIELLVPPLRTAAVESALKKSFEFAILVLFYLTLVDPLYTALVAAVFASIVFHLTEPILDRMLDKQRLDENPS